MLPGGPEFRSPLATATGTSINQATSKDFTSPTTRKHVSMTNVSARLTPDAVNDDEAERKERRRSKVLGLQRRHLNSPATPSDRQTSSAPLSSLNNHQLGEHYANCIKLSTENKINAKNAFGLHLIDYMSELLKKKEITNFQVASSTLDASAKIYAGRVDAIHSETFKVLTGLGRGAEKESKDDDGEEHEGVDQDGPPGAKKRKQTKRGKTIETNMRNINMNKLDLAFETDPLFHKTSAAFDEGGTAGLLLNHLRCRDDTSELILDSNTVTAELDESMAQIPCVTKSAAVQELKKMFLDLKVDKSYICPEFADFEFMNWSSKSSANYSSVAPQTVGKSSHAFDLEAEAESIPETTDTETDIQDYPDDGLGLMDHADDDDDAVSRCGDLPNVSGQSFSLGDNNEAHMVQKTIKSIKHGTVGTLMQVLALEPSDYSYFNTNLLQTWAGPSHWKLRPKSKGPVAQGMDPEHLKKPRERKEAFVMNFDEEVNFDKHLKETKASTMLTRGTLDKYSKGQNTLPEDLHYEEEKLFRTYSRPRLMIKRQKRQSTTTIDEQIENYDYDNANDKDNFCPAAGDYADDDDDDDNHGGFEFTGCTTQFIPTQDEEGEALTGDNLVAQPRKIAKIDIGYAKTAKKMDVKRLKSSIWGLLTTPEKDPKEDVQAEEKMDEEKSKDDSRTEEMEKDDKETDKSEEADTSTKSDTVAGNHSFQSMVKQLPDKVTRNMAKNLSVPIAFVCLLHLANEKTLELTSNDEMTDISINQG